MNNKEIRDALTSAFLDAGLTVRVVYARSTDSVYLTANNGQMPYTVRIANHKQSRHFSTVDDYWIDTTKENLIHCINGAIKGASKRFALVIPEYEPPVMVEPEPVVMEQNVDDYSVALPPQNLIDLAQYYVNEGYFMPEIHEKKRHVPESSGYMPADESAYNEGRMVMWVALIVAAIAILFYCLH